MHSRLSDNEIVFKHCYLDIVDGNRTPSPLKNRLNPVCKKCIKHLSGSVGAVAGNDIAPVRHFLLEHHVLEKIATKNFSGEGMA